MRLNESLKEKYNAQYQHGLLEKWDKNIQAVKKVYPKFDDISAINLAICCENTEAAINKYKRLNEGTQASDVGAYVRHAFELITGVMPNLVSEEVVSVQALNQKIGQIFFLKYVYGSTKGSVTEGTTAMDPYFINDKPEYTAETVDQELLADGTSTSVSATLSWGPVIPKTVEITAGTVVLKDKDGDGKLYQGTTERGTVNYETGAVSITYASAPGDDVNAAYQYNLEYAPTQAPQFNMEIAERIVVAKPRRLRTNYAFAAAYDVEKQFGINMDDELLEASIMEIKHEIDQEILGDLYRQAALTHSWDATVPYGISKNQHYESFAIAVNEAANLIRKATRRVKGNFIICGINSLDAVESLPGFIPGNAEDKAGAYLAGTIKNQIKVIANPFYDDDAYVVGYKGASFLEAGYVYAPYLPIFATSVVMLDDFVGRRGYATSYAKAMLAPNYYVKGTVTHSTAKLNVDAKVVNDSTTPVVAKIANDDQHPVQARISNTTSDPVNTKEVTP